MLKDVRENKHLFFYRTEVCRRSDGALAPNHRMGQTTGTKTERNPKHP